MNDDKRPNMVYHPTKDNKIKFRAIKDINPGEELTISYGYDVAEHTKELGFDLQDWNNKIINKITKTFSKMKTLYYNSATKSFSKLDINIQKFSKDLTNRVINGDIDACKLLKLDAYYKNMRYVWTKQIPDQPYKIVVKLEISSDPAWDKYNPKINVNSFHIYVFVVSDNKSLDYILETYFKVDNDVLLNSEKVTIALYASKLTNMEELPKNTAGIKKLMTALNNQGIDWNKIINSKVSIALDEFNKHGESKPRY